jgi:transposase-like protein
MRTRSSRSTPIRRSAFAGFCFPPDVIVLAVRWYLRFGLSYRDVEELLAERGIEVDHTTIYRCVQRFTPLLADAARPCRHAVGDRWQVDETYVKVAGRWRYVYRAIDQFGQVIDVFVSQRRDATAARRFFERAAHIQGQLDCTDATMRNDAGPALDADGLHADQDVLLSGGFEAVGAGSGVTLNLPRVRVGGVLELAPAQLEHTADPGESPGALLALDGLTYAGLPAGISSPTGCACCARPPRRTRPSRTSSSLAPTAPQATTVRSAGP